MFFFAFSTGSKYDSDALIYFYLQKKIFYFINYFKKIFFLSVLVSFQLLIKFQYDKCFPGNKYILKGYI